MAPASGSRKDAAGLSLPGQSVWAAVDRMAKAASRVEGALRPSLLKRVFGGGNREYARAVVAATYEESSGVRRALVDAISAANREAAGLDALAERGGEGADAARSASAKAMAVVGTCERILAVVDRWREASLAQQEGIIGSDDRLLSVSGRMRTLAREIKNPSSGING